MIFSRQRASRTDGPQRRVDAAHLTEKSREARNMSLSMAPLLMHSEQVPAEARDAIRAAYDAPPHRRTERLEAAARVLHQATGLACSDVRELVGLPGDSDCV
jgi:hypothetical protein